MEYKLRISAINAMGDGPEVELKCKTKRDKPSSLIQPEVIDEDVNEGYIPVRLSKASERNGPVRYDHVMYYSFHAKYSHSHVINQIFFIRISVSSDWTIHLI